MENIIIRSKLSNGPLINAIAFLIFFSFLAGCLSCIEHRYYERTTYEFLYERFLEIEAFALPIVPIVYLIWWITEERITITEEEVIVDLSVFGPKQFLNLADITNMNWRSMNKNVGFRNQRISINEQNFTITFQENYELALDQKHYSNFAEMRSFFFDYCTKAGIIQIAPLSERKKSIFKRKLYKIKK